MDSQLCPLQTKKSAVVIRSNSIAKLLLFFAFLLPGVAELSAQNLNITSGTTATFDENATGTVYTAEATSDQFSVFFSLGSSKDEILDDGKLVTIITLTKESFVFTFEFDGGGQANLVNGTSGNYTISVNK